MKLIWHVLCGCMFLDYSSLISDPTPLVQAWENSVIPASVPLSNYQPASVLHRILLFAWILAATFSHCIQANPELDSIMSFCKNDQDFELERLLASLPPEEARMLVNSRYHSLQTPLGNAAYHGHAVVAQILITHGADPNLAASDGQTALHCAAFSGHAGLVWLLLAHGANPHCTSQEGSNALHWAVIGDHASPAVVRPLLTHGGNPDCTDNDGRTPLHCAVAFRRIRIAHLLLDCGANPDCTDPDGWTPLHEATFNGDLDTIRTLLARGANPECRTKEGSTPRDIALQKERYDIFNVLSSWESRSDKACEK